MALYNRLIVDERIDLNDDSALKIIKLGGITPIGTIQRGGDVKVSISIDGVDFEEAAGDSADGQTALYVRLENNAPRVVANAGELDDASREDGAGCADCAECAECADGADRTDCAECAECADGVDAVDHMECAECADGADRTDCAECAECADGVDAVDHMGCAEFDGDQSGANRTDSGDCAGFVRIYAGSGYTAAPDDAWSGAFKRYEGWAGGDGIYSINLSDGNDNYNNGGGRTLLLFSDTIVSAVDRQTLRRSEPVFMPNNTYALLDGGDPQKPGALRFYVNADADGKPVSFIKPNGECFDYEGAGITVESTYFWNQDGVVIDGKLYIVLHHVTEDRTREEGFQFRVLGEVIAEAEIRDGVPDIKNARQHGTGLYIREGRYSIVYGAGILPYTRESGFTDGDGYIYVYGRMSSPEAPLINLCVARVLPEDFADWTKWRFFDGAGYSADIRKSVPLLGHVCSELSVTPIVAGINKGRFVAVFKYDDLRSDYVAYALGDSPVGPFGGPRKIYYTGADRIRESVYTYNAKAHPHLSPPESLLVSYNVNCRSWSDHMENGHIYRPRFIRLRDTSLM